MHKVHTRTQWFRCNATGC